MLPSIVGLCPASNALWTIRSSNLLEALSALYSQLPFLWLICHRRRKVVVPFGLCFLSPILGNVVLEDFPEFCSPDLEGPSTLESEDWFLLYWPGQNHLDPLAEISRPTASSKTTSGASKPESNDYCTNLILGLRMSVFSLSSYINIVLSRYKKWESL